MRYSPCGANRIFAGSQDRSVTGDADRHGLQGVRTAGLSAARVPTGRPFLANRRNAVPLRALCDVMSCSGRDNGENGLSRRERISFPCFSSTGWINFFLNAGIDLNGPLTLPREYYHI